MGVVYLNSVEQLVVCDRHADSEWVRLKNDEIILVRYRSEVLKALNPVEVGMRIDKVLVEAVDKIVVVVFEKSQLHAEKNREILGLKCLCSSVTLEEMIRFLLPWLVCYLFHRARMHVVGYDYSVVAEIFESIHNLLRRNFAAPACLRGVRVHFKKIFFHPSHSFSFCREYYTPISMFSQLFFEFWRIYEKLFAYYLGF